MSFWDFLVGSKERMQQVPTQSPQGMALLNQLMSQGMQNTDFNAIENMYKNQFYGDILPGIADQWSSVGDERNSSGFQSALGRSGSDLMSRLAAMRSQYGLQQSQLGLTPQFETMFRPATQGFLQQMAGPVAQMGLGLATGGAMNTGLLGRSMMNQWRNPGKTKGFNFAQALPFAMMGGMR